MTTATLAATWATAPDYGAPVSFTGQHEGAVALKDGKSVLVAGGADPAGAAVKTAGVFDTTTAKWTDQTPLGTARLLHTVTLLPGDAGLVLVTGGRGGPNGPALGTAELYDPAKKTWTPTTGSLGTPRWGHSAVVLANGKVLIAGGSAVRAGQTTVALATAELFDPADQSFKPAAAMSDARTGHTAVVLQDGAKVLVCGGTVPVGTADDPALAFCELYDTAKGTWKVTGSLTHPRAGHTATALSASKVLVTGGIAPGAPGDGSFDPLSRSTTEVYDLGNGETWQPGPDLPGGRAYHRAISPAAGQVLVLGGTGSVQHDAGYRGAVLFQDNGWVSDPGLLTGRWGFAAAVAGSRAVVVGGVERTGPAAATPPAELTKTTELR